MRILIVADEESKFLWDFYREEVFNDIDLIISAGDLKSRFLVFLNTVAKKPLLYVVGNHDDNYITNPPLGCDAIDDHITVQDGIRILGLGGSYRYKSGPHQYSEEEMTKRIKKLKHIINQFNGFDILVTHSPAKGHGDGDDLCHTGFDVFNTLIDKYKPSYLIHGHQHLNYSRKVTRTETVDETIIINGYNYYMFNYEPNNFSLPKPNAFSCLLNTMLFYLKYHGTKTMHEYKKYKASLPKY